MGECLNDRPFCWYWVVGIPIQYLSMCVGFQYTVVCIVWLGFGVHLVSKKVMLPSLSWQSRVNFMWSSILFIWINRMSTWSFLVMQVTSYTYLFQPWCGNGALWSQCKFFKIFHINIYYDWWDWKTHCCSLKLLVKLFVGMRKHSCSKQVPGEQ